MPNRKDMCWRVYYESWNGKEIKEMNVFDHGRFREDVMKLFRKKYEYNTFARELKGIAAYYFWAKCEWELVLTSWVGRGRPDSPERKIDVFEQLQLNWDAFVNYVWQFRIKPRV